MKKFIALLLALLMCTAVFAACGKTAGEADTTAEVTDPVTDESSSLPEKIVLSDDPVRVFTLKGPTGMGMAKLISDTDKGEADLNYQFTVASSADEFTGDIIQGNFEIAAVPTNLAAVLYAKTQGAVSVAAVNTLGVLYVLENGDSIKSAEDLAGKTIYSSGQGAVPEYALNYILDAYGIECEVIYEAEHDAVVSDLVTGKADIAILPEPKVTAALKNADAPEGLRVALDLNELWDEACAKKNDSGTLYMGCIIVNNTWAEGHKDELAAFLKEYEESVKLCSEDVDTAAQLIADAGIIPAAPVAKAAMANCHIVFITGDEMKNGLKGFYEVLYGFNPASVGGALPEDSFYLK